MQYSKRALLALAVLSPAFTSSLALPHVAVRDNNVVAAADSSLLSRHLPGAMPGLRSRHGGGGNTSEGGDTSGLSGTGGQ